MTKYYKIIGSFLILMVAWSCDRNNNNPGWDYFPDMAYSRAYETNSPNPNFANHSTMRVPVKGTIPRGIIPFPYQKTDEDRIRAGKELVNPLKADDKNVERGKVVFQTYCIDCHGAKGDGQGFLFTSGKYPMKPASLISDKVKDLKDGEIYHVVTLGFGVMGAHGSQIRPQDRWKLILYIRNVLQKN